MVTEAISPEFLSKLEARGVSRRSFMKLCGSLAVAAGLSELAAPRVARAIEDSVIGAESGGLYPAIWIEGASCTGCTESFAQVDAPDPATVVLEMVSLNYCETLSAAAGWSMEEAKAQTIEAGNYILIYEGAVLEGWNGEALRVANEPGTDHLVHAAENANAVVALGSCAVNGGWMGANPNSAGALGVQQYLKKQGIDTPVINIPGCPANPEWLEAVLVDAILVGKLPELTAENKPKVIFCENVKGLPMHDKGRTLKTILGALKEDGYVPFYKVLNSKNFGVPQNRERIYIVAFREDIAPEEFEFPTHAGRKKTIRDIMEDAPISPKYYLSDTYMETLRRHRAHHEALGHGFGYEIRDLDGIAGTIVCGGMGRERNLIVDHREHSMVPVTRIKGRINAEDIRKMTPREWARLQGFPDSYKLTLADTQLYKQFGNSVTVPVIKAIAVRIKEVLDAQGK